MNIYTREETFFLDFYNKAAIENDIININGISIYEHTKNLLNESIQEIEDNNLFRLTTYTSLNPGELSVSIMIYFKECNNDVFIKHLIYQIDNFDISKIKYYIERLTIVTANTKIFIRNNKLYHSLHNLLIQLGFMKIENIHQQLKSMIVEDHENYDYYIYTEKTKK